MVVLRKSELCTHVNVSVNAFSYIIFCSFLLFANALSGIIDEDICEEKRKGKYVCVGTKIKD